jgi:hypothetical protein
MCLLTMYCVGLLFVLCFCGTKSILAIDASVLNSSMRHPNYNGLMSLGE